MYTVLLIFAMSVAGESGTMAIPFESMTQCEGMKSGVVQVIADGLSPTGARVDYISAVCVTPAKVMAS